MRLIDGDKLYKTLAKPSDIPGDTIDVMEVRLAILAAPEVEAIPKKWIRVYAEQICWGDEQTVIEDMVEQWEQENDNQERPV